MMVKKIIVLATLLVFNAPLVSCKLRGASTTDDTKKANSYKKSLRQLQANGASVGQIVVRPAAGQSNAATATPTTIAPAGNNNKGGMNNKGGGGGGGGNSGASYSSTTAPQVYQSQPASTVNIECFPGQTLLYLNAKKTWMCMGTPTPGSSAQQANSNSSGGGNGKPGGMNKPRSDTTATISEENDSATVFPAVFQSQETTDVDVECKPGQLLIYSNAEEKWICSGTPSPTSSPL